MVLVTAGPRRFDVDLIVLDKDGTLFEFASMWVAIYYRQIELLQQVYSVGEDDLRLMDRILGIDRNSGEVDPYGPLALAPYADIASIMAGVLYLGGMPWGDATTRIANVSREDRWPPLATMVRTIGDVRGFLGQMRRAGIRTAILTTDDRRMTDQMLALGGLSDAVPDMVCAGEGIPLAPAPDGILALCQRAGVPPARTMMVGDAPTDLQAGRAAGVAAVVGVLTGVGRLADLAPLADVVLPSIHGLQASGPD